MPVTIPAEPLLAALAGAIADRALSIGYRRWQGRKRAADEWYKEAIHLASYGQAICNSAKRRSDLNFGNISNEAKKLSNQLNELLNPHPSNIDESAVVQMHNLELIFSKLHTTAQTSDEKATLESIKELIEMATRESRSSSEADMGKALEESTEYSSIMSSIFQEAGFDPRTFGPQFREKLEDADSIEDLMRAMGTDLGVSDSSLIEKRLEDMFTNDEWDESLSIVFRANLQIASNLSLEALNNISEIADQEAASAVK